MEISKKNKLYTEIRDLIIETRSIINKTVNFVAIVQNWEIGRTIVEEEQGGETKAEYGKNIIKVLSEKLIDEFGNSYDERNLRNYRQFYLTFSIENKIRVEFENSIRHALRSKFEATDIEANIIRYALRSKCHPLFQIINPQLTWTHYRSLLRIENPKARDFYIKEAVANNWGTRALDRQINTLYYERLLSSNDRKALETEMQEKTKDLLPEDVLKDPYILEFLQLKENRKYIETEIELALIDKMNEFLLELGRGFAFVARQKRVSTESKHFYIDLVFYNYLLKCFVLIDIKTGELTHQDIGQMDMYVRLYEDKYKSDGDSPTIGLILCTKKDHTVVKYSVLNENKQLFASKYQLYLPTEQELIDEIDREKLHFEQHLKE